MITSNKAKILLLFASIIWGTGFIFTQITLDEGLTPFQIMFGRFLIASILLNIIFLKKLKSINKEEMKKGILIGVCLFFGFAFQTYGQVYCSPSVNAFITATYVMIVPFLTWVMFKIKPDIYSIIACALTVMGVAFISVNGSLDFNFGAIITLISALFFALQIIFTDRYAKKFDPINLTIVVINLNTILSFFMVLFFGIFYHDIPSLTYKSIISTLYMGVFSTTIAYIFQNVSQKYISSVAASIICSLECIFAAIFSFIFFKEVFTLQMLIGFMLVFFGIIVCETKLKFLKFNFGEKIDVDLDEEV